MASHDPADYRFSTPTYVALYTTLLTAYYIWDTAMSQKSRFKMQTQGITTYRKTFPQLPWGTLENPSYIQTAHGNRLLTDGWWAYSRKPVRLLSRLPSCVLHPADHPHARTTSRTG